MYDELLERLHKRIALTTAGSPLQDDLKEAADAIEELAAFKAQITDGRFYVYKLGTLFELKHDPRELVVRHQDPAPPKEEWSAWGSQVLGQPYREEE
jgi:hypothetical protein